MPIDPVRIIVTIVFVCALIALLYIGIKVMGNIRELDREFPEPPKDPEKRACCAECQFAVAPTRAEAWRITAICGHPTRNRPERDPITGIYKLTRSDVARFNNRGQCRLFKRGGWVDLTPVEHEPLTRFEWQ